MKKFLLFVSFSLIATIGSAQVIFYVEAPSSNEGNYGMTYANGATWGVPDMTDPLNAVMGTICMADDNTVGDSLACNAVNSLTGLIAVLYRGDCEFGVKALNCQNAGAIGVIVINNIPGAPVDMGAGAQGINVTIPLVMISDIDGAVLKAEAEACSGTTVFIGSKSGFYDNDLGFYPEHILRAKQFGNIQSLSQDASEFDVELGGWVYNYGNNDQANVTLSCDIPFGSYSFTSTPILSLASGDSAFIPTGTYSATSYTNGYYDVTYVINSDSLDEFPDDDTLTADFMMSDSIYAYSRVDPVTFKPLGIAYYRGASSTLSNAGCVAFNDSNGSRVAIHGMTYSASTSQNPDPTSTDGEFIEIIAYQWLDNFVDLNDGNFGITNLVEVASGEYIYTSDLQSENIYIPFEIPVLLEDNQRYLFCVTHGGENLFTGYDTGIDYTTNLNNYVQPQFPGESDGTWFTAGFGSDIVPALTVNMFPTTVGIEDYTQQEIISYPNPASLEINIPLGENYGDIQLSITDMSGKIVNTQNIKMVAPILTVDVSNLASGTYVFNLTHSDNKAVQFKVNVSR